MASNKGRSVQARNKINLRELSCSRRCWDLFVKVSVTNKSEDSTSSLGCIFTREPEWQRLINVLNKWKSKSSPADLECCRHKLACSKVLHNRRLVAWLTKAACASSLRRNWMRWLTFCFVYLVSDEGNGTMTVRRNRVITRRHFGAI